jgi:hypothetical protein
MTTNHADAVKTALLDSLIPITPKELKAAHYRITAETRDGREAAGRRFRIAQPMICDYLPYSPSVVRALAGENALICSFARHLCAAVETTSGQIPVLRAEVLRTAEAQATALLANRSTKKRVKELGAVQFAEAGILGVHYFEGIGVIPDAKRVLRKVLTLLICFSDAIQKTPISNDPSSNTLKPAITS